MHHHTSPRLQRIMAHEQKRQRQVKVHAILFYGGIATLELVMFGLWTIR